MTSSSSDPIDLEKAPPQDNLARGRDSGLERCTSVADNKDKDCEGWAAGQDSLAPVCSRISSHRAEEARSHAHAYEDDDDDDDEDGDDDSHDEETPGVISRVLSRITSKSSVDPGPPPDGGVVAWTQCKPTDHRTNPLSPTY